MEDGKRGRMEEPIVVRVWWEVPLGSRRSVDVRQRMRKRPVERKSAVFSDCRFLSGVGR